MIELGNQHPLVVVGTPTLGDIDIDPNHPLRSVVRIERNEAP